MNEIELIKKLKQTIVDKYKELEGFLDGCSIETLERIAIIALNQ